MHQSLLAMRFRFASRSCMTTWHPLLGMTGVLLGLTSPGHAADCSPAPGSPPSAQPVCAPQPAGSTSQAAPSSTTGLPTPASSTASTPAASTRAYTMEVFAFAPFRTTDTTTVQDFDAVQDLTLRDSLSILTWATAVRATVEQGRIGLLTDLSYVQVEQAGVTAVDAIYDLALRYRFGARESATGKPGQFTAIPYGGMRVIDQRRGDVVARTAWQPLIGAQASVFLAPRWRLFAQADLSGSDLATARDYAGTAQLGLAYAITANASCNLSWRYLGVTYADGQHPSDGIKLYKNGVELGLKLFF